VCFRQLLPREEIDLIRKTFTDEVESVSVSGSGPGSGPVSGSTLAHNDHVPADDVLARYPRFVHPHRHPETEAGRVARQYLVDERLVKVAESLIGDAYGAQTMFYFKPPGARGQAMHQDNWCVRNAVSPTDLTHTVLVYSYSARIVLLLCPYCIVSS
jgi:hypothetical protein